MLSIFSFCSCKKDHTEPSPQIKTSRADKIYARDLYTTDSQCNNAIREGHQCRAFIELFAETSTAKVYFDHLDASGHYLQEEKTLIIRLESTQPNQKSTWTYQIDSNERLIDEQGNTWLLIAY